MSAKKTNTAIAIIVILAVLAGAGYLTRGRWLHYLHKGEAGPGALGGDAAKAKECYVCPMHTQIVREKPGDCPICGMSLVKKTVGAEGGKTAEKTGDMDRLGKISLDPRQRMLANVATSMVMPMELSQDVNTVGLVKYNEATIKKVSAWFPGRVEKLYVDFTGQPVKKGEKIISIYSPELVSTEKEYLIAKDAAGRLGSTEFKEITRSTEDMLDAARTRMKLWGITNAQIDELDRTGKLRTNVDVYSPIAGTVVEIMAREGNYLAEGSELYKVADLSRVWVLADVYEYELHKVGMGSKVEVTTEAYPGRTFTGRVSFIDPSVNTDSRTVKVRAEFSNPGGLLKPEMFVNVRISSRPVRALSVPASAVLYTGTRNIVWVESEPGVFEMRDVQLGMRSGDSFQVLSGLNEHEMVVSQGGFLIDSEAQLRASAGGMAGMPGMEKPAKPEGNAAKPEGKGSMPGMPGM